MHYAAIFYFCIMAGSKHNFYGPLGRHSFIILLNITQKERNLFSLCKSVFKQGIRVLKFSLSVVWNATQFAVADLGTLKAAIGESKLSYQGCLQIHAWCMVVENKRQQEWEMGIHHSSVDRSKLFLG